MTQDRYDVIVVGAGGAGLTAAIAAAEEGASVIVFESEGEVGGSTQLSAGMLTAGGTRIQRELGVEDSVERFFQHYMDLNQWLLKPGLIWRFCERSASTLDWLIGLGVDVPATFSSNAHTPGLCRAGVEDVWRGHVPRDQGYGVVQVLEKARRDRGIDLVLHTRVERLLSADGRVGGVVADGVEVTAPATIVTSGGLSQDADLRGRLFPAAASAGDDLFVVAAPGSRGDHIRFGESVGASIAGKGWGLLLPTASFVRFHHWQAGFPPASRVYLNQRGRRFMDEDASYAVSTGQLQAQDGEVWAIFDEAARLALPQGYANWTPEQVMSQVEAGTVLKADTVGELADLAGIEEAPMEATIERWNAQLPAGRDDEFQRERSLQAKGSATTLAPIGTPPFYATRIVPNELVCTHAGMEINESAEVLDTRGNTVPGLYAAGEAGAGVLGARYVGGGNSVANAIVMGRLAGQAAASRARG